MYDKLCYSYIIKGKALPDPVKETKEKVVPRLGANAHEQFSSLSRHCDVTYKEGQGRYAFFVKVNDKKS